MNASHKLTRRNNVPFDPLADEAPGHSITKSSASAKHAQPVDEALPDPIIGVYGALRGLIDKGNTGIVVHVVSATQGEDASTIAKSIAVTAATAGSGRVLLIDAKLPSRELISKSQLSGAGQKMASEIDTPVSSRLVHVQGSGDGLFTGSVSNAAQNEKVNPQEVKDAYAAWRQEYDLVIVDCPAVSTGRYIDLVPEAADWVVLVVQAEKLRPAVLRKVRDTIEQQGGKILGVILKDAKRYIPKFIYRLI